MNIQYMVSYWLISGLCGNRTCESPFEARKYIKENKAQWRSYSTFTFEPGQAVGELTPYNEPGFSHYTWEK